MFPARINWETIASSTISVFWFNKALHLSTRTMLSFKTCLIFILLVLYELARVAVNITDDSSPRRHFNSSQIPPWPRSEAFINNDH